MKKALILSIIIPLILALAGVGIGIYAATDPDAVFSIIEDIGIENMAIYLPLIIIGLTILIIAFAFAPFIKSMTSNSKTRKMLQEKGMRMTAKVINVTDTSYC